MAMGVGGVGRPDAKQATAQPPAGWSAAVANAAPPPGVAFTAPGRQAPPQAPPQPNAQPPANAPGQEGGSWLQRGLGLLQTVGGVAETIGGGALVLAPEPTMITKVVGGAVAVHGIDDIQAGLRSLWTGRATPTATQQAATSVAEQAGASHQTAERIGAGVDIAAGVLLPIGASRLAARNVAARAAQAAGSTEARAAGQAANAAGHADEAAAAARAARHTAATAVVATGGAATAADAALAVNRLAETVPASVLQQLEQAGVKVVVAQGSITEHLTHLKGVQPRGWPPGSTWESVAGAYNPATKEAVVATREAADAGRRLPGVTESASADVLLHEVGHAVNNTGKGSTATTLVSDSQHFQDAYNADKAALGEYYQQAGAAGRDEAFAEGFARYLSAPADMQANQPSIYRYFHDLLGSGT